MVSAQNVNRDTGGKIAREHVVDVAVVTP